MKAKIGKIHSNYELQAFCSKCGNILFDNNLKQNKMTLEQEKQNLENKELTDNSGNTMLAVRVCAELLGWESFKYDHLPNKVHRGEYSKNLGSFEFSTNWNEFMKLYFIISEIWNKKPDSKKSNHALTAYYRAIQNRILLSDLKEAFELSAEFIQEYNLSKADR